MPLVSKRLWPTDPYQLLDLGRVAVRVFCLRNGLPEPAVSSIPREQWRVSACAYYRPEKGIQICVPGCGRPCGVAQSRNWSWPGNVVDREPYGVVCHELGHHVDYHAGEKKWVYGSEYSEQVMEEANELGLTSYANENPSEWFAEAFRLFVTNPNLLQQLRPRTWAILSRRWQPIITHGWQKVLGDNVPPRVVRSLINKGAKPSCTSLFGT